MTFTVRAIGFWAAAMLLGAAVMTATANFSQAQTPNATVQSGENGWNCGGCGNGNGNGGNKGGCYR